MAVCYNAITAIPANGNVQAGNAGFAFANGTTAQRQFGFPGMGRLNTTTGNYEITYDGIAYTPFGGNLLVIGQLSLTGPAISSTGAILLTPALGMGVGIGGPGGTASSLRMGAASPVFFYEATNTFFASFSGAAASANATYTWPPTAPTVNGSALTSSIAGVMSWGPIPELNWVDQIATPVTMAVNTSYIADTAGLLTFNVPAVCAQGSVFRVAGNGAGGWLIRFAGGQTGNLNSTPTTVAGSFASSNRYNCLTMVCTVANTTFTVLDSSGVVTVA